LPPSKNGGNGWVRTKYPGARRILITADGGGSNGHHPWLWKFELAGLAAATGLDIVGGLPLPSRHHQMEQG
jgi:hypothetical protein